MRCLATVLVVIGCCALSGCNAGKIAELTAQVDALQKENAALKTELEQSRQELAKVQEIRQGYEAARTKLQQSLAQVAPILGITPSPLPAFEDLKNSDWADKLFPSAEMASGLRDLQNELQGLLGTPPARPAAKKVP